jgi:hypothetical protein
MLFDCLVLMFGWLNDKLDDQLIELGLSVLTLSLFLETSRSSPKVRGDTTHIRP